MKLQKRLLKKDWYIHPLLDNYFKKTFGVTRKTALSQTSVKPRYTDATYSAYFAHHDRQLAHEFVQDFFCDDTELGYPTDYAYTHKNHAVILDDANTHIRQTISNERDRRVSTQELDTICFVHPFYPFTVHGPLINTEDKIRDAKVYLRSLTKLLDSECVCENKTQKPLQKFLVDTLWGYATTSSVLVEAGLIDKAYLTCPQTGRFIEESQRTDFIQQTLYIAGAYHLLCLNSFKDNFKKAQNVEFVYIENACLNSPTLKGEFIVTDYEKIMEISHFQKKNLKRT
jgi:hypothetical protein